MKDYWQGMLVRVLKGGESTSGRIYTAEALQDVADLINRRVATHVNLGHAADAPYMARIVKAEVHDGAVWGCLAGIKPRALMAMREGAPQHGADVLGLSILAEGITVPSGGKKIVRQVTVLGSVDLCTRSTPLPQAGGEVPFDEHGLPIGWEDRGNYWRLMEVHQEIRETVTRAATDAHPQPRPTAPVGVLGDILEGRVTLEDVGKHIGNLFESVGHSDYAVRSTFLDRVVAEKNGRLFEMSYRIGTDGLVDLYGDPRQVKRVFVPVGEAVAEPVFHCWD
jgi:hypothetical protein